jgi:DNA repair photolyase
VTTPQRRIKTIARLASAGLDVGVNVAPVIPGLGDEDMAEILTAAAAAGAKRAGCIFLRLPGPVATVFEERVRAALPLRAERILARVREARGGKLNDARFGKRQRGEGPYADAIFALFEKTCARLGLNAAPADDERAQRPSTFARPPKAPRAGEQLHLNLV